MIIIMYRLLALYVLLVLYLPKVLGVFEVLYLLDVLCLLKVFHFKVRISLTVSHRRSSLTSFTVMRQKCRFILTVVNFHGISNLPFSTGV